MASRKPVRFEKQNIEGVKKLKPLLQAIDYKAVHFVFWGFLPIFSHLHRDGFACKFAFLGFGDIDKAIISVQRTTLDAQCNRREMVAAVLRGSLGFAVTSIAGFAVWAFAGRELSAQIGEVGLYAVIAVVFVSLSGLLLHPLMSGSGSLARFYRVFIPAFLAYALVWCAAWFTLGSGLGEWLGSFAGCAAFVAVAGWMLGGLRSWPMAILVLFVTHSAGYFLGGKLMYWMLSPVGLEFLNSLSKGQVSFLAKLGWGLLYGLGMGAGLGYTFLCFQKRQT